MAKKETKEVVTQKPEQATAEAVAAKPVSSKKVPRLERVRVYVNATYNNTVISVTDGLGNVLMWASAGSMGFAGPKKATPFAASKIISVIAEKLKPMAPEAVEVYVRGVGSGRDSAIRSLIGQGFNVVSIKDVTPIPHNGPRPPKLRRV